MLGRNLDAGLVRGLKPGEALQRSFGEAFGLGFVKEKQLMSI